MTRQAVAGDELKRLYRQVREIVCSVRPFREDTEWVDGRKWKDVRGLGPANFLLEHAYVVLCSGFRNAVVEKFWQRYADVWGHWTHWESADVEKAVAGCDAVFKNKAKNRAVGDACLQMRRSGWSDVRHFVDGCAVNCDYLQRWPWIGPVTKFHLGRNLGLDVVKPDRHMLRWAEELGYATPLELCEEISRLTGERVGTADVVLWRFAESFGRPSRSPIKDYMVPAGR